MIVSDTNLLAYFLISGDFTDEAEQIRRIDSDWAAPVLWKSELCNVFALYMRKNLMSLDDAIEFVNEAEKLIGENEYEIPAYRVLTLVESSGCTSYDCEFVVLAQDLGIPLVTADKKLIASFPDIAISLSDYIGKQG